jgi:hypothetical protein
MMIIQIMMRILKKRVGEVKRINASSKDASNMVDDTGTEVMGCVFSSSSSNAYRKKRIDRKDIPTDEWCKKMRASCQSDGTSDYSSW